jgi:hypothetical protein
MRKGMGCRLGEFPIQGEGGWPMAIFLNGYTPKKTGIVGPSSVEILKVICRNATSGQDFGWAAFLFLNKGVKGGARLVVKSEGANH